MEAYAEEGTFTAAESARGLRGRAGEAAPDHRDGQGRRAGRRRDRGAHARCSTRATSSSTPATRTSPTPSAAPRSARERGLRFMGIGVSGGEEGALLGPSIMPGGDPSAYAEVEEILTSDRRRRRRHPVLRARRARRRRALREDGAQRHRVRRHPAHRRGLRPAHPRRRPGRPGHRDDLRGVEHRRPRVVPHRDHREGAREDRREDRRPARRRDRRPGRAEGHRHLDRDRRAGPGHPAHRHHRGRVRARALGAARRAQGGVDDAGRARTRARPTDRADLVEDIRQALYASKVVAYAQGFAQMRAASKANDWDLDLGAMATIWRGGCIIRAQFLNRITRGLRRARRRREPADGARTSPRPSPNAQDAWRRVVVTATEQGVAIPAFASSLSYYDGYRRERGPANLIQGLRDFFGAHTYRRIDAEGSVPHALAAGRRRGAHGRLIARSTSASRSICAR